MGYGILVSIASATISPGEIDTPQQNQLALTHTHTHTPPTHTHTHTQNLCYAPDYSLTDKINTTGPMKVQINPLSNQHL